MDYLLYICKRILTQSFIERNWIIRNLRQIAVSPAWERLYADCGLWGDIKGLLFIKVTLYFRLSTRKKISQKQNIASMETSYQFSVSKVPVFRRNKASNSSTSKHPFFQRQWRAEWKPLYLVIYSRFLDLPSHWHEQFSIGDNEKNKANVIFFSFISKW